MTHPKRKKNRHSRPRRPKARFLEHPAPNPVAVAAVEGALDAVEGELERVCPTLNARQRSGLRSVFGSLLGIVAREVGRDVTLGDGELAVKVRPVDLEAAGVREMHRFVRVVTDDFVRGKLGSARPIVYRDPDDDVTAGGNPIRACPDPDDD